MEKQPLIILTGPTAVGKTALSIKLAKAIQGEIISADSMQVYRNMDIGSAKILPEEMDGIRHHLIDVLDPDDSFDVVKFQTLAKEACNDIVSRGKIPIVTGGTGFYIQALLYDIDFTENEENTEYRKELEQLAAKQGSEYLHTMLEKVDPKSAASIHANNVKRVIRALEFFYLTKTPISEHNEKESQKQSPYDFHYFVLNDLRENLYKNIDHRVDIMFEKGLPEEVTKLMSMGCKRDFVSMQGLGYKEVIDYLSGTITLEEAIYIIKRETRHFAKRQLTWFRREKDVIWIQKNEFNYDETKILEYMLRKINGKEDHAE